MTSPDFNRRLRLLAPDVRFGWRWQPGDRARFQHEKCVLFWQRKGFWIIKDGDFRTDPEPKMLIDQLDMEI